MARILVIDDDAQFRAMLTRRLESAGHDVVEAEDGEIGLQRFAEERVDVAIVDLIMPRKEGLETIMEMRRESPDARIIAVSGGGRIVDTDTLPIARRLGARYVFAKPFGWPEMRKAIEDLVEV